MGPLLADIFWDANGWYFVEHGLITCENKKHEKVHDAIVDAINHGYTIREVRGTRGSVSVGTKYA